MNVETQQQVIRVLKELGFVKGSVAFYQTNEGVSHLVTLVEDPSFLDTMKTDVALVLVKIPANHDDEETVKIVSIGELENVSTTTNSLDLLIDDIKSNPTPVKETWVMKLNEIKTFIKHFDPIMERRRNQWVLIAEAESLELQANCIEISNNSHDTDLRDMIEEKRTLATKLRDLAFAFDRTDKNVNRVILAEVNRAIYPNKAK